MPGKFLVVEQVAHEDAGAFGPMIEEAGFEPLVARMHKNDPVPLDPAVFDGILVMGGPMNADQVGSYPCLADQLKLISEASRLNVPLLGVCLGSQLVAAALGGKVYAGEKPEIGWYQVEFTASGASDPLLGGFPNPLEVFQWHGQTYDLPPEAVLLAGSSMFPHQAFRAGEAIWGVQFHLEVTAANVSNWLEINRDEVRQEGVDAAAILATANNKLAQLTPLARQMFGRFLDICHSRTGRE
jgi:GMP synthase (glutamine-hydrolysing)